MVAISTAWVDSQIRWEWISSALNKPLTVYADIWVMPTSEACVLVNRGLVGRISA